MTSSSSYADDLSFLGSSRALRLRPWVVELTYKPGWRFAISTGYGDGVNPLPLLLNVHAPVLDSVTLQPLDLVHTVAIPDDALIRRDRFRLWVLHIIARIEAHEAMEFLRASGERVAEPHPLTPPLSPAEIPPPDYRDLYTLPPWWSA